jgi:signal transduction histidine kinase
MKHKTTPDLVMLTQAFGQFNEAAEALSGYYDRLTQEISNLNLELQEKNLHLAESLAEQARTKKFLAHILDNLNNGVLVLDPEGCVALANQAAITLLGESFAQQAMNSTEQAALLGSFLEHCPRGEKSKGRQTVFTEGPEGRLLSITLVPFDWPGDEIDSQGMIAMVEDVTGQAQIGVQRQRSNTLTAMGEMAAEIAHQIRNPLGSIELFASLLGREVAEDDNQGLLVENILSGVKRVNHLITNYLTLAHPPKVELKPLRVDALLEDALTAAAQILKHSGITVRWRRPGHEVLVKADPELILQVFLSLILNSIEAMDTGGWIEIELHTEENQVKIVLRDNGCGIEERNLGRVFNPFYTTKDKSLGLGLAVSHRTIDAHHGFIEVKSKYGRGTTVTVTFPKCETTEILKHT